MNNIADTYTFHHWLKVNIKPFKSDLLTLVSSWADLFKNYLFNDAVERYARINLVNFEIIIVTIVISITVDLNCLVYIR